MRASRLMIGAASVVAFCVAFFLVGTAFVDGSWPGRADSCVTDATGPNCYREPIDDGSFVKQPWSTYSTVAFCAVGLLILARADRSRRPEDAWFGFVALFMGPGSALFHGTLTQWGGWGDVLSMYALLAVIVAVDVVRIRGGSIGRWFWSLFGLSAVLKAVSGDATTYVFIAMGVGTGVFVLASWARWLPRAGYRRSGSRLAVAYTVLFAAIVPWLVSNPGTGAPTDVPWHAAWHVVSALFVGSYWWYFRSEVAQRSSPYWPNDQSTPPGSRTVNPLLPGTS